MINERLDLMKQKIGEDISSFSVSPFAKWMGGKLLAVEEGLVEIEITVREDMCNPLMILHGGVAAAIMDELMGWSAYTLNRAHKYTTINLNVEFLSVVKIGEKIICSTSLSRAGQKILFNEANIKNKEGKLAAKCTASFCRVD